MKVIKSLQNKGNLLKGTTTKFTSLPLMKNVLTPSVKSVLIPLGLTSAASATVAAIQKKMYGSGTTALKIKNGKWKI